MKIKPKILWEDSKRLPPGFWDDENAKNRALSVWKILEAGPKAKPRSAYQLLPEGVTLPVPGETVTFCKGQVRFLIKNNKIAMIAPFDWRYSSHEFNTIQTKAIVELFEVVENLTRKTLMSFLEEKAKGYMEYAIASMEIDVEEEEE